MKYKIGDTVHWVYSSCNYSKKIPCPMCFGKRFVDIILGDGSQIKSMCGACDRGCESATGIATAWGPEAKVRTGTIQGVSLRDGVKYDVDHSSLRESEIYSLREDAEKARDEEFKRVTEQADQYFRDNFRSCTKKQIWSAQYHRDCIERSERDISWHQLRLGLIKQKAELEKKP